MARRSYSEQERKQIRKSLMATAIQCIAEKGLIHTSVDLLCRNAGISKTFFYSFFPSKEELVLQALRYQQPKLLHYAQTLMDDPDLSWRESIQTFIKNCCYGAKNGIAVLSLEEEQEVYHCLTAENFRAFQQDQCNFFEKLLCIFGIPANGIDPRLFGNVTLTMMMVYKGIPNTMPFLFSDVADDMVDFQINALLDEMERAKTKILGDECSEERGEKVIHHEETERTKTSLAK